MFVEVLALASGEAEHKLYQAIESFSEIGCKISKNSLNRGLLAS
jgi:hypothetical protein